ncbi:MAG TPA: hypothetical protein VEK57_19255 [Thermoanaerobaculia bacterium]|nr:hypothetical protein [Thermoanaerobaculia bacterium]
MRRAVLVLGLLFLVFGARADIYETGAPRSTNNDDSCDISLLPAATLLLPYFEVDLNSPTGETTLFTVMNMGNVEQIAHVTLWTDYAFPVLGFNIYLTGYDVQSIDLRDVLSGRVAPPAGTGMQSSPTGPLSLANPALRTDDCTSMPAALPPALVTRMQQALTLGRVGPYDGAPACTNIGGTHSNAAGYLTIDLVGSCTMLKPTEAAYYTETLRFDNVLAGDYQQVNGNQNFAQGSPLVHIRAVPENGGTVNLPFTFYRRFLPEGAKYDRRQPLPSNFAARWIEGGTGSFDTSFKVWREGITATDTPCNKFQCNAKLQFIEFVSFDEEENALGLAPEESPVCTPITNEYWTTTTFRADYGDGETFPEFEDEIAGWMYMNLATGDDELPQQAWVISSMAAQGRYSGDIDATAMGNGCSPRSYESEVNEGNAVIGPAANVNP